MSLVISELMNVERLRNVTKALKKKKKKGKAVFAPHLVSILSQAFCGGRAALPRR